ncbi:MAG: single-stranded DNA-binding protein [bacterium]
MNLNKAMVIGNLTRDPEVRTTPNGKSVASFSVATSATWVDQSGQKQEKAEFHNIVAWGKLSDIVGQYVKKGSKVYVEGRLQTREWSGQDNIKRYRTEIIAENLIMLGSASGNQGGAFTRPSTNNSNDYSQGASSHTEPVIDFGNGPDEEEIKVENIPF